MWHKMLKLTFGLTLAALTSASTPMNDYAVRVKELSYRDTSSGGLIIHATYYKKNKSTYKVTFQLFHTVDDGDSVLLEEETFPSGIPSDGELPDYELKATQIGKDNAFTFAITTSDPSYTSEKKTVHYRPSGEKYLEVEEKHNHKPLNSGYYKEIYTMLRGYEISEDYFIFDNFEETVVEPVYKYFDIRRFRFTYHNSKGKTLNATCRFSFYDAFNLFPGFPIQEETMFRSIPLTIYADSDGYYHFAFGAQLYFQPTTYQSSMIYEEGYRGTSFLYFPKRYADQLNDINCLINIDVDSFFDYNISATFSLKYEKKFFGHCNDSAYCIESEMDYGNNVKEHVYEVEL
ncbi:MAG: hypothetical protein MJ206_03720 [Bacilli bacterium]|nr:hypothetical protein [Bacilli bacterium]